MVDPNRLVDKPRGIRSGEELDTAKLHAYLREHLSEDGPLIVEQFPSGHSNLTYFLKLGDREFVLRRPPFGSKVKSAHDMGREFKVLSGLHPHYPPAPKPLHYCEDEAVIGAKFYVMERIRGVILRQVPPEGFEPEPGLVRQCCLSFVENLAQLHGLNYESTGLAELRKPGQYTERQVTGWAQRYTGSQTDDIPSIDQAIRWLEERIPQDTDAVLIHNDYKFDNIVLDPADPTRIIGVLDWEMATIGDPLTDLGTALGYWTNPGEDAMGIVQCFLTSAPGAMTRLELAEYYAQLTGRDVSNLLFYYIFALVKLAVIVQQIYYRYKHGLTQDERFAILIEMVRLVGAKAASSIEAETA
jgi:aminoglycoside phosphotransferase (APT) family kinase protein